MARQVVKFAFVAAWLFSTTAHALEVPKLEGRVNDRAGLLSAEQRQGLEIKLKDYETKTGHQLALLTIATLEGDPIEDFSIRVVEAWKLGSADRDDGLLLLIATQDRKMRIEVGHGLEGAITDRLSGQIIRNVIAPRFREAKYAQGIEESLDLLMRAGAGESVGAPTRPRGGHKGGAGLFGPMLWTAFILAMLARLFTNRLGMIPRVGINGGIFFGIGYLLFGSLIFGLVMAAIGAALGLSRMGTGRGGIFPGGFYGGGGFGGGGGGGFSGGGGSFGGGGSSGGW